MREVAHASAASSRNLTRLTRVLLRPGELVWLNIRHVPFTLTNEVRFGGVVQLLHLLGDHANLWLRHFVGTKREEVAPLGCRHDDGMPHPRFKQTVDRLFVDASMI